jgi:hypothetical protein
MQNMKRVLLELQKISKLRLVIDKLKQNMFPFWPNSHIPMDFELKILETNPI